MVTTGNYIFKVPVSLAAAVRGEAYTLKSRRMCLAWY